MKSSCKKDLPWMSNRCQILSLLCTLVPTGVIPREFDKMISTFIIPCHCLNEIYHMHTDVKSSQM